MASSQPPVTGMPIEVWSWLRDADAVRPDVVARVRAALARGEQATADQVAHAMVSEPRWVVTSPFRARAVAS